MKAIEQYFSVVLSYFERDNYVQGDIQFNFIDYCLKQHKRLSC